MSAQITSADVLAYSVTTPDINGGGSMFILHNGRVTYMQTPLKFMGGWSLWQVIGYCRTRRWLLEQTKVPV